MREVGYKPAPKQGKSGEHSFVRPLEGLPYPRFHIYLKENKEKGLININLHLDQKKPSYKGSSAHSGEYEGEVVKIELQRILTLL